MKIVFVSDAIYPYNKGGKEKRLHELSTRLSKLGHDVHIYTMHWWQDAALDRQEDGVTLHAISPLYSLYNGDKRSIKEGIMFGLHCLKLFKVDFDALDVDHMPFFPIYAAWIVCTLRGRKFFGTWHEALSRQDWIDYMGFAGNIAAGVERISIHMPYAVSAASAHTQRLVKSELHRTKRVALIASGIDTQLMDSLNPAKTQCDVLYVGRLVKDKNVDKLIEAIAIVAATNPGVRCRIIGHGIEQPNLVEQIKQLELQQQVTLLAPLPESADIYRAMKAAKVFCLPSIREGFGIVALEALGCGTPVITIDSPANATKDLIQEGVNGSVVPLDALALADAIIHWTTTDRPKQIKGKVASYDWDALARAQVEVYSL